MYGSPGDRLYLLQGGIVAGLPAPIVDTAHCQYLITPDRLREGLFIDIPDAPELQHQDVIQLWWGASPLLTQVDKSEQGCSPSTALFFTFAHLRCLETGPVRVSYQVQRDNRLVGVSAVTTVHVVHPSQESTGTLWQMPVLLCREDPPE